ncbi:MAG TPA: cobalamin-dependent protein [Rhodocyclaceae bacterium]|nr:cobalamin-dependent protein [Rhodocyclaceae bacterium]
MDKAKDASKKAGLIFKRYDLAVEAAERQVVRQVSDDDLLQRVATCLVAGDEDETRAVVTEVLHSRQPLDIINRGLIPGMKEVSRLWDLGEYFLPQVILSSDAMIAGIGLCEEKMGRRMERKAKVVTHTAEGDIHDIGMQIVNALLRASGFDVITLGADVPVDDVVEACRMHKPVMVTGTALMTTTMTAFPRVAARLKSAGLEIPFVCGGGAVSEDFVTSFDYGIWGKEAGHAPAMAEDALNGLTWRDMRAKWNG